MLVNKQVLRLLISYLAMSIRQVRLLSLFHKVQVIFLCIIILSTDKGYYKEPGSYENPGRDYVFSSPDPLWVFGHGLSYTTFDFEKVSVDKQYYPYDTIQVSVQLKNTGKMKVKK